MSTANFEFQSLKVNIHLDIHPVSESVQSIKSEEVPNILRAKGGKLLAYHEVDPDHTRTAVAYKRLSALQTEERNALQNHILIFMTVLCVYSGSRALPLHRQPTAAGIRGAGPSRFRRDPGGSEEGRPDGVPDPAADVSGVHPEHFCFGSGHEAPDNPGEAETRDGEHVFRGLRSLG